MTEKTSLTHFTEDSSNDVTAEADTASDSKHSHTENEEDIVELTESNQYGTPKWIIRRLTKHGLFDLDPAAGAEDAKPRIATHRYTKSDNGLNQSWSNVNGTDVNSIWLNPPYENPLQGKFLRKLRHEVDPNDDDAPNYGIALTKTDVGTGWFQDNIINNCELLCFLRDRLKFQGADRKATFSSVLSVFGKPPKKVLEELAEIGDIYTQVEVECAHEQQRLDELILTDGGVKTAIQTSVENTPVTANQENQAAKDIEFVSTGQVMEIEFTETSYLEKEPTTVTIAVSDTKMVDEKINEILITGVGKNDHGDDVCVSIQSSPKTINPLGVSIATDMGRWREVSPTNIQIHNRHNRKFQCE